MFFAGGINFNKKQHFNNLTIKRAQVLKIYILIKILNRPKQS